MNVTFVMGIAVGMLLSCFLGIVLASPGRGPSTLASTCDENQSQALFAAIELRETLRLGVEWNDDYMRLNKLSGTVQWVERARKLLDESQSHPQKQ
jgi:hypothetical protein